MRILIVACPLMGHVNTVLPMALAAHAAGHDVRFATGPDLAPYVAARGLSVWPVGPTHAQAGGNRQDSWLAYFEATADRRAMDLLPLVSAWQPQLVIHEETELAGALAATLGRARQVVHGLGVMPARTLWGAFQQALARLGERWVLPDTPGHCAQATYLHVCPPSLRLPGPPLWERALPLQPQPGTAQPSERVSRDAVEQWVKGMTIHLTLGTIYHGNVEVLRTAIEALRTLDAHLVVSVGAGNDPALFGPQPPHVELVRYLPHAELLPHCDLVVSQGGAGILFGAFAHGLPQLVLPQGADQFVNAERAVASGAALSLAPGTVTPDAILHAVRRLMVEPSFSRAARGIAAEIQAMPSASEVLACLVDAMQARRSFGAQPGMSGSTSCASDTSDSCQPR